MDVWAILGSSESAFFLMALISTVESLTFYYVQVAVFGAWAACGVVAGIARMASVPWAGRLQAILVWIAFALLCVPLPSPRLGAASLSFIARIERAHSDRARSVSKKDGWLFPIPLTS